MKAKKVFWGIVLAIAMLVVAGGTCFLVLHFFSDNDSKQYIETTTPYAGDLGENHGINWAKLKKKNKDVYSWIYVPGTKVDYAVLQPGKKRDDLFYMNHNLDKKYEFAGSIFSEKLNRKDYSDPVTVLYGHNMLNGSMFATLHKFKNHKFFKKHKYMYVYQPKRKITYKIYSAYTYDDRHIMNSFDFGEDKDVKKYQKSTLKPKAFDKNVRKKTKLDLNSKILTLSTCTNGASNTRYLVQGVLIKDEQTN